MVTPLIANPSRRWWFVITWSILCLSESTTNKLACLIDERVQAL